MEGTSGFYDLRGNRRTSTTFSEGGGLGAFTRPAQDNPRNRSAEQGYLRGSPPGPNWSAFEVKYPNSVSPKLLLYLRLLYEDPIGPGAYRYASVQLSLEQRL